MTENTPLPDPPPESFTIRCPRLGHEINFSYCHYENNGLPCFKTLDCWYSHFDVTTFLKAHMTSEAFAKTFQTQTRPKILSLMDLIEQAKKNKADAEKGNTP